MSKDKKNLHAVALGKLGGRRRAEALSKEALSQIGRQGGIARARALTALERTASARKAGRGRLKTMSKADRSEAARLAAEARWKKKPCESLMVPHEKRQDAALARIR